jgi:hypothetical protein
MSTPPKDEDFLRRLMPLIGPFPEWVIEAAEELGVSVFEVLRLALEGKLHEVIKPPKLTAANTVAAGKAVLVLASLFNDLGPALESSGNRLVQEGEGEGKAGA